MDYEALLKQVKEARGHARDAADHFSRAPTKDAEQLAPLCSGIVMVCDALRDVLQSMADRPPDAKLP